MKIQPNRPDGRDVSGSVRPEGVESTPSRETDASSGKAPGAPADRVDISSAARELARTETTVPSGSERVQAVRARLASGFYDQDGVRDTVLGRMIDELGFAAPSP